jgi:transposase
LAAEVACWAHVERKFNDIHVAASAPIATDSLTRIGRLH